MNDFSDVGKRDLRVNIESHLGGFSLRVNAAASSRGMCSIAALVGTILLATALIVRIAKE
jgi:hypothetical protein